MIALVVAAFLLGLFGSVHCIAMCGGIASVLSAGVVTELRRDRRTARWSVLVAFHLGRISTYAAAGAVVGAISLVAIESEPLRIARGVLRGLSGVALIAVGLHLAGVFPRFAVIERAGAPLWRRAKPYATKLLPVRDAKAALLLGGLWGLVPCAMVYTALVLGATTGSPARSAIVLAAFGLGTAPALLSFGVLARAVAQRWRGHGAALARRVAGVVVTALGVMSVLAGVLATRADDSPSRNVDCTPVTTPIRASR
ncbi:sulfite exporter TauE/SafE family protein [soil metagenome]